MQNGAKAGKLKLRQPANSIVDIMNVANLQNSPRVTINEQRKYKQTTAQGTFDRNMAFVISSFLLFITGLGVGLYFFFFSKQEKLKK